MIDSTRRDTLKLTGLASALFATGASSASAKSKKFVKPLKPSPVTWALSTEGQRKADLGNGIYLNPIFSGDHPDPSLIKVIEGSVAVYYMTFSSFETYPGLLIYRSYDLLNWEVVTATLTTPIGSVWAPDLCYHNNRFYIYFPTKATAQAGSKTTNWVIWADKIEGPWSEPIDLHLTRHIDPGHAVAPNGTRLLFLSGGDYVALSNDGLSTVGDIAHSYDPWRYPSEWDVESFSPEGPKVFRRGDYYYLITAVGGTAGPPTGHMVIAARSKSVFGPWEHHPDNPLVRSKSAKEQWWSRGHATVFEAEFGQWWCVYHGYENGYMTLGRQTLLAPVTWRKDGWFSIDGGDLSQPIKAPKTANTKRAKPNLAPLSDDFQTDRYGPVWSFFRPNAEEKSRLLIKDGELSLKASGTSPKDSSPLCFTVGEHAYEITCEVEISGDTRAGLLLFYDHQLYCGLGFDEKNYVTHQYGQERGRPANPFGKRMWIKLRNRGNIISYYTSSNGQDWRKFDRGMEVSGYHHNVRGGFLSLKPGLYAAGSGSAIFRNLTFKAIASE